MRVLSQDHFETAAAKKSSSASGLARTAPVISGATYFRANFRPRAPCWPDGCEGRAAGSGAGASRAAAVLAPVSRSLSHYSATRQALAAPLRQRRLPPRAPSGGMSACYYRSEGHRVGFWPANARPPHRRKRAEDDKSPAVSPAEGAPFLTQREGPQPPPGVAPPLPKRRVPRPSRKRAA